MQFKNHIFFSQYLKHIFVIIILFKNSSSCNSISICDDCIRNTSCAWCSEFQETKTSTHCWSRADISLKCAETHIIDPQNSKIVLQDAPLRTDSGKDAVQISPQRVKLSLRQGEKFSLPFKFSRAKDYPLDLYLLLDLSRTLCVYREELSNLGEKLPQVIKNLTSNFRMGFGSFIDKVKMPFTSTLPKFLKNPCAPTDSLCSVKECAPPYGYKNHLSLSEKTSSELERAVKNANFSGNIDAIEGSLDALMQVMVCKEQINWSDDAIHLIVLVTNEGFHMAGDGKLAGIIEPNDGLCHLENNVYTYSDIQDYPSIGQIRSKLLQNHMYVIFVISSEMKETYRQLSKKIGSSKYDVISKDAKNVMSLINNYYKSIVTSVKMTSTKHDKIDVQFYSSCNTTKENKRSECHGLEIGKPLDFRAEITLKSCDTKTKNITIDIRPEGLREKLTLDIEMLCECPCKKQNDPYYEKESDKCSNEGDLVCGLCQCKDDRIGDNCECNIEDKNLLNDFSKCIEGNSNQICSGRGVCKCGICQCQQRSDEEVVTGKYCECSNFDCPADGGNFCSGNGECICGKCKCFPDFSGENCQCSKSVEGCKDINGTICSDHGTCDCNACECHDQYTGKLCDSCPTCPKERCPILAKCVACKIFTTEIFDKKGCNVSCDYQMEISEVIEESSNNTCTIHTNDSCVYKFVYYNTDNMVTRIKIKRDKICPQAISAALLSGILLGTILLGLIVIFLCRLWIYFQDRMEYKKFEQQRNQSKFSDETNPLYKNPNTEFKNPLFAGSR